MSKPKLFVSPAVVDQRDISEEYLENLRKKFDVHTVDAKTISRDEFLHHVEGQFGLLVSAFDVIDEEIIKAAGNNLKVVSVAAAGYDKVDTAALKKYGVRLGSAGNVLTAATAEMAVCLLLAQSRSLMEFVNDYKCSERKYNEKNHPPRMGLEECIVGIIGAGRVGISVAQKVAQFSICQLLYYSREEKTKMTALGGQRCSLEDIARKCDYMIIALAYNKKTYNIINKDILNLMKPTAQLVNIGRGGLIDHDALLEVLQQKKIAGAALDVTDPEPLPPDHPLCKLENVILTPHIGGLTFWAQKKSVDQSVENIWAVAEGRPMIEEVII